MAGIEHLTSTGELKTTLLTNLARNKTPSLFVYYDREFDALTLQVVSPGIETVVHYVDDHVAILYQAADLEIVGLQVEDFERSFLPEHVNVQRVWRWSDSGITLEDVGDLILAVERKKRNVAVEVAKATETLIGEPAAELAAAIA